MSPPTHLDGRNTDEAATGGFGKGVILFFRKVYNVANMRIERLCEHLGIQPELRQRIWTMFEYAITHDVCEGCGCGAPARRAQNKPLRCVCRRR